MITYATTASTHVALLDALPAKGIRVDFYDPDGTRHGLPTYPYRWAPKGLCTRRQLRAKGLRPGGQDIAAQILWRHRKQTRVAYLYREDLAKPKRHATPAQLEAIRKALQARRTCPVCGRRRTTTFPGPWANATTATRGGQHERHHLPAAFHQALQTRPALRRLDT